MTKTPDRFFKILADPEITDQRTTEIIKKMTFSPDDHRKALFILTEQGKFGAFLAFLEVHDQDVLRGRHHCVSSIIEVLYTLKDYEKRTLFIDFLEATYKNSDKEKSDFLADVLHGFIVRCCYMVRAIKKTGSALPQTENDHQSILYILPKIASSFNNYDKEQLSMASTCFFDYGHVDLFLAIKKKSWDKKIRERLSGVSSKFLTYYFNESSDADKLKIMRACKMQNIVLPEFSTYLSKKELTDHVGVKIHDKPGARKL